MAKDRGSKAGKLPILVKARLHAILTQIAETEGRFIEAITHETLITGLKLKYPAYKEQIDELLSNGQPMAERTN